MAEASRQPGGGAERRARGDALAVLDAADHDRLHQPRSLAALRDQQQRVSAVAELPIVLAHGAGGHWLIDLGIYLGPVVVIGGGLWFAGWRERRNEDGDGETNQKEG